MRKISTLIGIYLVLSVLAGLTALLFSYPRLPSSPWQWACLFLLALPATIVLETIGNWIWRNPLGRQIESRTRDESLSLVRIAYGVAMAAGLILLALAGSWAWQSLRTFLAR